MIAGYVTFDELKIITGYPEKFLKSLLLKGLNFHEITLDTDFNSEKSIKGQTLFSLKEVEEWIKVHVF